MGCDLLLTAGCPAVLVGPSNSTGHWCRQLSESSVYTLCWVDSVNIPQSNPIASAFCLILLSVSSVYLTSSSSLVMSQPRDVLIMCPYHRVPVLFSYPTTWSLEVLSGAWQGVWTPKKKPNTVSEALWSQRVSQFPEKQCGTLQLCLLVHQAMQLQWYTGHKPVLF